MSQSFPGQAFQNHAHRRSAVDFEEQRAWVCIYKFVKRDAALATEVLAQLESDAEMKRRHLALYLSCQQSLRLYKARQARNKCIGLWFRMLVQLALLRPMASFSNAARRVFHRSSDVLAGAWPTQPQAPASASASASASKLGLHPASLRGSDRKVEPATAQVRSLFDDTEYADAYMLFQHQAGMFPVSPCPGPEHGLEPRDDSPAPAVQVSRR